MSILGKIIPSRNQPKEPGQKPAPKPGKTAARLKQANRLLDNGKLKEAGELIAQLWDERDPAASAEDLSPLRELRLRLFSASVEQDPDAASNGALNLAEEIAADDKDALPDLAEKLAGKNVIELPALRIIREAAVSHQRAKRLLLSHAKHLLSKRGEDNLAEDEMQFLIAAAEAFPLWREGTSLLADKFLREGRRDSGAVVIYRNAYPHRKADRRLREVLLETLVALNESDEFAASVYKDAVETGEHLDALRLLAEHYIQAGEINQATAPYLERALEKTQLSEEALKTLSGLLLNGDRTLDQIGMAMHIYRQGYSDSDLLAFLSDKLAEAGKFDDLAIEIMTQAFEQRMITKRAVLILTEHCLANERDDDFAVRVYETYLSTWPDRPQRRIYSLLAHHYSRLTRVDDQAQKIYEEALEDNPTDSLIVQILARAYHAADRRDEHAELLYRQAFPQVDGETKQQLATVLAEIRVEAQDFSQETLQYLTTIGKPSSGSLAKRYDEALTNCFLAAGRRGEQAQESYFSLFERTEESEDLNPRLVRLLADIIKESGQVPQRGTVQLRVYRKLFDLDRFSTDANIAFVLVEDMLGHNEASGTLSVQLAVVCFEANAERFVELVRKHDAEPLLQAVGDFYVEHYNFEQASRAFVFQAGLTDQPTDEVLYRLAKIHLLEGQPDLAIERLIKLRDAQFAKKRLYFEAAAYMQKRDPAKVESLLSQVDGATDVPKFLLDLRRAMNQELQGNLEQALEGYRGLKGDALFPRFERWLGLEEGIVLMRLGRLNEAESHLEEIYRHNPGGRAEQLFLSLALFFKAHTLLRDGKLRDSLALFSRSVEVNRNHRLLRSVVVDVLAYYGETAFFRGELERAAEMLELANRVLPKRMETKKYLGYTYHRLKDYPKAILFYRDIDWDVAEPEVERSQAYAYMENGQPEKAWKVFLDLAKRGHLTADNFPRTVATFLADNDARGLRIWENVDLTGIGEGVPLAALLLHDGDFELALQELTRVAAREPDNAQVYWYLGRACSQLGKREMAVHNWKRLLELCVKGPGDGPMKLRQLTEIGLAFLAAGYATEAMQTWAELRKLDERNPDLAGLYAATLDLNAYQMARKDQVKLARDEWKKALDYDPSNASIQQNFAIACLLRDELDEAAESFRKLGKLWQGMVDQNPRRYIGLARQGSHIEKLLGTFNMTKERPEFDLSKIRAEDTIDFFQRANQFYWILGLEKGATKPQVEREYFRLIKIFNPERHADDFMLVEEAYTNLFKDNERRSMLDLVVFNPTDLVELRSRLTKVPKEGEVSFEKLELPASIPPPEFSQLKPRKAEEDELDRPLADLLGMSFKIPDWTVI